MEFNVDELVATFEAPVVVINGEKFTTKPLSFKDYLINQKKLSHFPEMEPEEIIDFITHLCELTNLPADKVLSLPMAASMKVIVNLFTSTTNTPSQP